MPAKKKTAAKKTVKKKATATKSSTEKVVTKKTATKKVAAKKTATKKVAAKKTADQKPANGETLPKASELLNRTKHHTPAIFKVGTRKAAPVVFSLEDVREILKKRAKEEAKTAAKQKETKKPVAPKAPVPILDAPQVTSKRAAASLADILGFGGATIGMPAPQRTVPRKWKKFHGLLIELRDHVPAKPGDARRRHPQALSKRRQRRPFHLFGRRHRHL